MAFDFRSAPPRVGARIAAGRHWGASDPNDPRRAGWDGRWPGEADAERLGFFIGGDRSRGLL
jgi:hypothetical protein